MLPASNLTTATMWTTGNDLRLQKSCRPLQDMICVNSFSLTESSTCGIMLCVLNLRVLTHLKQDWINVGVARIHFVITVPKFKEPEAEVKLIGKLL